jgi:hypothetical protein
MYMYVQVHVDQNIPTSLFTCPSLWSLIPLFNFIFFTHTDSFF